MIKTKYKMYTKRIISTVILLQVALIFNKEKPSLSFSNLNWDEGIEIIDEKEGIKKEVINDDNLNSKFFGGSNIKIEPIGDQNEFKNYENILKNPSGIFDSEECLVSTCEAKEILRRKYNITENKVIDKNLRFAMGKCHPVVFIPGLYSTRLVLTINCRKFSQKLKHNMEMRLYCGMSICSDVNSEYEEHVLWPALLDSPFTLLVGEWNKYSSCLGYFLKFQNKETECPKYHKKTRNFLGEEEEAEAICLYDEAVKITYFGGTNKTVQNSQCGIAGVKNIVSVGSRKIKESWVNSGAPRAFQDMYDRYYEMGYREGFSMAGLPFDFRRFIDTNEYFHKALAYQIERLYAHTGKRVLLIAHSYGCNNVLNGLLKMNTTIAKKVEKFIAIAPPFAGSPKLIDIYLHGNPEFDTTISIAGYELLSVSFDIFAQEVAFPSFPVSMELRPNPILFKLFNNPKYLPFSNALKERMFLEKNCREKDCDESFVKEFSKNFTLVFNQTFPSFTDKECNLTEYFHNNKEINRYVDFISDSSGKLPFMFPCRDEIFNPVSCPTLLIKNGEDASKIEKYHCFDNIIEEKVLYNHPCDKTKNCLDQLYQDSGPMPFHDPKLSELIRLFNMHFASSFNGTQITIDSDFFDTYEDYLGKVVTMRNHQNQISTTKELPPPPVDTTIIFSNFIPTKTSFIFDANNKQNFDYQDILMKGGDGTVPNWSSLLVGMKWLYEKNNFNLTQKFELVEYCSKLSKANSKYLYNKTDEKVFHAIGCSCLDSEGIYIVEKFKSEACHHSPMISDPSLIHFVENYLISEELLYDITQDRMKAVKDYDEKYDYNMKCNQELKELFVNESGSLER